MFGLEQIKAMNEEPKTHALSELSDGQERRNNSEPSNYWSEQPGGDRVPGFDVVSDNDWPAESLPKRRLNFGPDLRSFGKSETQVMPENIAEMQAPTTAPRLNKKLPPIYFDAIKVSQVLDQIAVETAARHSKLLWAIRDVREAVGAEAKLRTEATLRDMIRLVHDNKDIAVRLHVEELANTIEHIAPANPLGYVPHMGLHHAMHPVRKLVNLIKTCFADTVA